MPSGASEVPSPYSYFLTDLNPPPMALALKMDRKKQKSIDSHFQRTVKMKTGEIVQVMPSKVKEDVHFLVNIPTVEPNVRTKGR